MEQHSLVENKNFKNQTLSNETEILKSHVQSLEQKQTNKLNFKSLRDSKFFKIIIIYYVSYTFLYDLYI